MCEAHARSERATYVVVKQAGSGLSNSGATYPSCVGAGGPLAFFALRRAHPPAVIAVIGISCNMGFRPMATAGGSAPCGAGDW